MQWRALSTTLTGLAVLAAACKDASGPSAPPPPPQVTVSPATQTIETLGDTVRLTATARDAQGQVLRDLRIVWTSSNIGVVAVDSTGLVLATGAGVARITASADGGSGTADLTVTGSGATAVIAVDGGRLEHPSGASVEIAPGTFTEPMRARLSRVPQPSSLAAVTDAFTLEVRRESPAGGASRPASSVPDSTSGHVVVRLPVHSALPSGTEVIVHAGLEPGELDFYAAVSEYDATRNEVNVELRFTEDAHVTLVAAPGPPFDPCEDEYRLLPVHDGGADDPTRVPVIFIHGWQPLIASCADWKDNRGELPRGVEIFSHLDAEPGLEGRLQYWRYIYPTFNSIDEAAWRLVEEIQTRPEFADRQDVILIGHSMGGLVARTAALRHSGAPTIHHVITLGTPHEGSPAATRRFWLLAPGIPGVAGIIPFLINTDGAHDLRPDSPFLNRLRQHPPGAMADRFHALSGTVTVLDLRQCGHGLKLCAATLTGVYAFGPTANDAIVPLSSAQWTDAAGSRRVFSGYDHFEMSRGNYAGSFPTSGDPLLHHVTRIVQEVVVPPPLELSLISAGTFHTCGTASDGATYCWGHNANGQLGVGDFGARHIAAHVPGFSFRSVASGAGDYTHTCAVTENGIAYCWGGNEHGQVGIGATGGRFTGEPSPRRVATDATFWMVDAGSTHTCGVTRVGDVFCWGSNFFGELGTGTQTPSTTPVRVQTPSGLSFKSVVAGAYFSCALSTEDQAFCWGSSSYGQLGNGTFAGFSLLPVAVHGGHRFTMLSTVSEVICGVTTINEGYCWGGGRGVGERGDGTTEGARAIPGPVMGGHSFRSVSAGYAHGCGITTSEEAFCWGENRGGQLGVPSVSVISTVPVRVVSPDPQSPLRFRSISAGSGHTCGLTAAEDAYCWGVNSFGQLGDGTTTVRGVPTAVGRP
jgi:alpha-tubulin suppressor-like RCC1 family protein/pimeloyl-ACP methyl ester carboxylesterase